MSEQLKSEGENIDKATCMVKATATLRELRVRSFI